MSAGKALEVAVWLHREGRIEEAESVYRVVLSLDPYDADAMHYLGVLRHQMGDAAAAEELIRASLTNAPDNAAAWNNLGNVLRASGDRDGALAAYGRSAELDPAGGAALNNLGVVLNESGRFDEAREAYVRALAIEPGRSETHRNLGHALERLGRIDEAVDAYAAATALKPEGASYRNLSYSLHRLGKTERAVEVVREWLARDPDDPVALHHLAAFSGENVPARAPDRFVLEVFDRFAETFDAKLRSLEYRVPELVGRVVAREMGEPRGDLCVLDAGCGTGLCGPLLRPFAARLVGVDLSSGMLARARARGGYDELVAAELTGFLEGTRDAYDLIVFADTLVYFGDLRAVARAVAGALRRGGVLVFTVEDARDAAPEAGYRLNPHGRYSHSEAYLRRVFGSEGLAVGSIEGAVLRQEAGAPVAGLLVAARKLRDA